MRLVVFFLAAVNPPRLLAALPERGRTAAATIASVLGFAVVVVLAAASEPILATIDVSPSTFRIAAGIVMTVGGAVRLLDPLAEPEPAADGWRAGVVPVAFPLLLAPDLGLLAVSAGADDGAAGVAVGAAVTLALLVAGSRLRRPTSAVVVGSARVLGALLVVAGVALAVDGIQDL